MNGEGSGTHVAAESLTNKHEDTERERESKGGRETGAERDGERQRDD